MRPAKPERQHWFEIYIPKREKKMRSNHSGAGYFDKELIKMICFLERNKYINGMHESMRCMLLIT